MPGFRSLCDDRASKVSPGRHAWDACRRPLSRLQKSRAFSPRWLGGAMLATVISVGLTVWSSRWAWAQDDGDNLHPLASQIKSSIADTDEPFTLVVRVKTKSDKGRELIGMMPKVIAATRKEEGCVTYQFSRVAGSTNEFVLYEHWSNLEALDRHLKQDYLVDLLTRFEALLVAEPEIQVGVPIEPESD
jgi:quinol monooxygenase YgiN